MIVRQTVLMAALFTLIAPGALLAQDSGRETRLPRKGFKAIFEFRGGPAQEGGAAWERFLEELRAHAQNQKKGHELTIRELTDTEVRALRTLQFPVFGMVVDGDSEVTAGERTAPAMNTSSLEFVYRYKELRSARRLTAEATLVGHEHDTIRLVWDRTWDRGEEGTSAVFKSVAPHLKLPAGTEHESLVFTVKVIDADGQELKTENVPLKDNERRLILKAQESPAPEAGAAEPGAPTRDTRYVVVDIDDQTRACFVDFIKNYDAAHTIPANPKQKLRFVLRDRRYVLLAQYGWQQETVETKNRWDAVWTLKRELQPGGAFEVEYSYPAEEGNWTAIPGPLPRYVIEADKQTPEHGTVIVAVAGRFKVLPDGKIFMSIALRIRTSPGGEWEVLEPKPLFTPTEENER